MEKWACILLVEEVQIMFKNTDKSKTFIDKIFLNPTEERMSQQNQRIGAFSDFPAAYCLPSFLTPRPPHRPSLLLTRHKCPVLSITRVPPSEQAQTQTWGSEDI